MQRPLQHVRFVPTNEPASRERAARGAGGTGAAWRKANAGHVSLGQLKVMSAIESCRTVALGGHVMRCEDCSHTQIAYNSCRNRHCPKCQGSQALAWMKQRNSELLDVPYFHVVFTLPARIAAIAYQNKAVVKTDQPVQSCVSARGQLVIGKGVPSSRPNEFNGLEG
jgi:hypothetical protein